MAVVVAGVVVVVGSVGELLGGSGLGAGIQVLDLGLAKDAVKLSEPWPIGLRYVSSRTHM